MTAQQNLTYTAHCQSCNTPNKAQSIICGKLFNMPVMCRCEKEKYDKETTAIAEMERKAKIERMRCGGIPRRFMHDWTIENGKRKAPEVMNKAQSYVDKWEINKQKNRGLLLWGNVGRGKTYFATATANALIDKGISVKMTSFPRILDDLTGFSVKNRTEYIERLIRYDLLIIDDLGVERKTDFGQEIVYNVIDQRILSNKPLIITTNLTLDQLKNPSDVTGARIYDRVLSVCYPICFNGDNLRGKAYEVAKAENAEEQQAKSYDINKLQQQFESGVFA